MENFLRLTVTGISVASVYAIAASGLVVTYTTSGIFNFAHGAFGMMAAFAYWQLQADSVSGGWGLPSIVALIAVVFVVAPIFGAVVERVIMRGLDTASEVVRVIVTVSLMLALLGIANTLWPSNTGRSVQNFFPGEKVEVLGVFVTYHRIIILLVAGLVAVTLRLVLYKTRAGVAMRAVVDDRSLVQLNGGRPHRSSMLAWSIGSSLAAVSGILVASEFGLSAVPLTLLVINAYAAAVIGKLKSLPLTFLGALILGLAEAYVSGIVTSSWFPSDIGGFSMTSLQFVVSPILLFAVMVFQPQAKLRQGGIQRSDSDWKVPTIQFAATGMLSMIVITWAITELLPTDTSLLPLIPGMSFALVALSLVPLTGYAGQISLAQLSFTGVGAVIMAVVGANGNTVGGLLTAVAACALLGGLVALPALRLSGIYLALATAAFSLFMSKMVFNQPKVFPAGNRQVPRLDLGIVKVESNQGQIMLLTVAFAAVGMFVVWLRRGPFGRRLAAMKDSPVACATLGMNLTKTKILVFSLSAAIAGLAGALSGATVLSTDYELTASMAVTMLAVVGGIGVVGGALVGGLLLGSFQSLFGTVFKTNAVGVFGFVEMSITDLTRFTPGFMGIGLARNPTGAIGEMAAAFRPIAKSRESIAVAIGGPTVLWFLARTDNISNWTFTACIVVVVMGVLPLVPVLIEPIPGGRALPAGIALVAAVVGTGLIEWETAIESNGVRVVAMIAVAIATARIAIVIHGKVPLNFVPVPSPDLVGVDRPLTRSDVIDADRALGVSEGDFSGVA